MIIPTSQNDYAIGFADGYRQGKKDAERKKGDWIIMSEFLGGCTDRCSVCGWEYDYNGYVDEQEYYNYCPNCGADMRGGEDG